MSIRTGILGMIAGLIVLMSPRPVTAITMLDISGPNTDFLALNAGESAGLGFTLDQAFSNVTITPNAICLSCSGVFVLMKDIVGPSATLSDLVFAESFSGDLTGGPLQVINNLDSATYFLILLIDSGSAGWTGNSTASIFEANDASYEISLFADTSNTDTTFPGRTNFSALFNMDLYVNITGTPTVSVIPLPASLWLFMSGLGTLILSCRKS